MVLVPTTPPDVPARPSVAERAAACLAPSSGGLRERKKRARREALVDAAQTLVLERGLDAVTVEDICAAVGVSPRTFFNYFPAKDDAVLGLEDFSVRPEVVASFVAGGPTGALLDDLEVVVADVLAHEVVTRSAWRARSSSCSASRTSSHATSRGSRATAPSSSRCSSHDARSARSSPTPSSWRSSS